MLNYADVEKMINDFRGIKHFVDVAKPECKARETDSKVIIKTSYMGLDIMLIAGKELESVDDNIDVKLLYMLMRYAKANSEVILDSAVGEVSIFIRDELNVFINNKHFNASLTFRNKKSKDLFFGLQDLVDHKINNEQFQELVNRYYYSIID